MLELIIIMPISRRPFMPHDELENKASLAAGVGSNYRKTRLLAKKALKCTIEKSSLFWHWTCISTYKVHKYMQLYFRRNYLLFLHDNGLPKNTNVYILINALFLRVLQFNDFFLLLLWIFLTQVEMVSTKPYEIVLQSWGKRLLKWVQFL